MKHLPKLLPCLTASVIALSLTSACTPSHAQDRRSSSVDNEMLLSDDLIVTTASKTSLHVSEVPAAVTVITAEQIEASGATTIPDLLRSVPGLDVVEPNRSQSNVAIRGFNHTFADKLLVMVDGRSIYQDISGSVDWNLTPVLLTRIKRIEIVRGPGSALYGANAFNGVVNIITKTPDEMLAEGHSVNARVARGGQNSTFSELTYQGSPAKDWAMVLGGGFHKTDGFGGRRVGQVQDSSSVPSFTGDFQKRLAHGSMRLTVDNVNAIEDISTPELTLHDDHWVTSDATLSYEETKTVNPLLARVFINSFRENMGVSRSTTYNGEIQKQIALTPSQALVVGGNIRYISARSITTGAGAHHLNLWSLYAQDDVRLSERTHLFAGLREDTSSLYGSQTSPRLSLVHHVTSGQTARLSYSTAFRTPSVVDSYLDSTVSAGPGFDIHVQGSAKLKPEQVTSLEAGYRVEIPGGYVGANLFNNKIKGLFAYIPTAFATFDPTLPTELTQTNVGKGEAKGFELESEFTLNKETRGAFNYSYQDVTDDKGGRTDLSARNKANLTLTHSFSKQFSLYLADHYVGSYTLARADGQGTDTIGSYNRLDANIAYHIGGATHPLTLGLLVTNLLGDKHLEMPIDDTAIPSATPQRQTFWVSVSGAF